MWGAFPASCCILSLVVLPALIKDCSCSLLSSVRFFSASSPQVERQGPVRAGFQRGGSVLPGICPPPDGAGLPLPPGRGHGHHEPVPVLLE